MGNPITDKLSRISATNTSLNKKSLHFHSSLRDVMRLLRIEEGKKKKK